MATRMLTLLLVALTAVSTTALYASIPDPEVDPKVGKFIRGDLDDSFTVQLNDAIQLLRFLFAGEGEPRCVKAADANDDGVVDVSDPILLLELVFGGEVNTLAAPYPNRGVDLTEDSLPCEPLPPARPHEEPDSDDEVFLVFDNGIVCVTDPCFHWTVVTEENARTVSDVEVSALLLCVDRPV